MWLGYIIEVDPLHRSTYLRILLSLPLLGMKRRRQNCLFDTLRKMEMKDPNEEQF